MTSRAQIEAWFDRGVEQGAAYLGVWWDTFDRDNDPDYPAYYKTREEAQEAIDKPSADRLMEVYNLRGPKNKQLSLTCCMALRPSQEAAR
jgi:hypothetical protein